MNLNRNARLTFSNENGPSRVGGRALVRGSEPTHGWAMRALWACTLLSVSVTAVVVLLDNIPCSNSRKT